MTTLVSKSIAKDMRTKALWMPNARVLGWIGLAAIVVLAMVLRLANLSALGYANHYYTAAVEAMLQSWHNFFFLAAEPGGSVSIDKPPVGLWLQAISAYFFGVNTLGVLLPQIAAGILSVIVVYHLVRGSFGTIAGLLAALVLAITPVVVATDRNNTMDSSLILTLLFAAWAFIKATESSRLRFLLLGAVLVGVGFNIKMLEAYLPLPAFYALYFLGARENLWRKIGKLALATIVLLLISFSWATVVDLTPANQRPYVGSSGDNSVWSLAVGYNGAQRLLGMGGRGGLLSGLFSANSDGGQRDGMPGQPPTGMAPPQGFQPPQGQLRNDGSLQDGQRAPGNFRGGGMDTGQPGVLRLFTAPLNKEASWLLPFGLFSAVLLVFRARPHWPLAPKHQALVLWGGWLLTGAVFFSIAGFFHPYYLSVIAPPLAVLVGIGVIELWQLRGKYVWLTIALLLVAALVTLWLQFTTASSFVNGVWWLPSVIGLFILGAALLIPATRQMNRLAAAGFACVIAALLISPGVWSGLTMLNSSGNQSLPAAYDGHSSGPTNQGGVQVNQTLLTYLESNTLGMKYLMAVPSSMQGADYVLATGRPVLYLGGFNGQDKVKTSAELAQMVTDGELRYIYWSGPGGGNQSDISNWVTTACKAVQGFDTATQNAGAPDGTSLTAPTDDGGFFQGAGGVQVTLYDCRR